MNIFNLTQLELEEYFTLKGENKAKAKILFKNLYRNRITDFSQIKDFSSRIIDLLNNDFTLENLHVLDKSETDDTSKLLFKLSENTAQKEILNAVETVLMRHDYGNGLCVSTQIGCNMGCVFCESGRQKKLRDLSPAEMVLQLICAEEELQVKISHITLMGIGEPLDNFKNLLKFIEIIGNPNGLDIAARHITISTCGLIPKINKLLELKIPCNLAVSLHAPNDSIRSSIMPINKAYGIKALVETVRVYSSARNKKTTFEYVMLKDINDSEENARELAALLKGVKCYVNLIPYNQTGASDFKRAETDSVANFCRILLENGIRTTIRREFGAQLKAACGQLRADIFQGKNKVID